MLLLLVYLPPPEHPSSPLLLWCSENTLNVRRLIYDSRVQNIVFQAQLVTLHCCCWKNGSITMYMNHYGINVFFFKYTVHYVVHNLMVLVVIMLGFDVSK